MRARTHARLARIKQYEVDYTLQLGQSQKHCYVRRECSDNISDL